MTSSDSHFPQRRSDAARLSSGASSAPLALFATVPLGIEELLSQELTQLGAQEIQLERAGAHFRADLKTAYRICLWSRLASRILLPIARFPASDEKKLYGGIRSIRWSDHLEATGSFAIQVTASQNEKSQLQHTHFAALKAKDAIVDQYRSVTGTRPDVRLDRPDLKIQIHLEKGEAIVSIDLSGESLHRRGYREDGARAPLKENLAAAILQLAGWPSISAPDTAFVDLMCGSGTLAIEAALMSSRTAPGFFRDYFGFLGWKQHDSAIWKELKKEAITLRITDKKQLPRFFAFDQDGFTLKIARQNASEAMVSEWIHFERRALADAPQFSPQYAERGLVGVNPPYGERLEDPAELQSLYRLIGDTFKKKAPNWNAFVFTGNLELAKSVGLKASRRTPLYNGAIECRLLTYPLY
ncbi:MAG: putative rRNA (2-N-methyl-G2445)-methyltransferase [Pseudomonadota bacterium]|jgi:23S rRNA (guanine2445-N2)-methyltransferase / 23S rRNA (guanine2069-N7)-methyltransferase